MAAGSHNESNSVGIVVSLMGFLMTVFLVGFLIFSLLGSPMDLLRGP